jgi:hypothetical protein
MTNPSDEGIGGTATGPTAVDHEALHENVEQIAVPAYDIVSGPVEGLVEPFADAMPDADEPETRSPPVAERSDTKEDGVTAPSAEQGEDRT